MQATVLTIGDELLIGQVHDTNAAWLGEQLTLTGVVVRRMTTVGDDEKRCTPSSGAVWPKAIWSL